MRVKEDRAGYAKRSANLSVNAGLLDEARALEINLSATLEKALDYYKTEEPRGEYVLVVEGKSPEEKRQEEIASWESMSIEEHMAYYEEQGMDNKSAMKQVAKDRGVGKREIYQYLHGNS